MSASAPRVMCLSNMWPGADDPDYGSFVADMCDALRARGLPVESVVIDRRGGPVRTLAKYAGLTARAARAARRADVIYAHYLFPTGAVAMAAAAGARGIPYVLTAHGQDVRNLERPALRRATAPALSRAAGLIAVSHHLAGALGAAGLSLPPVHVIDMGVDMERFAPGDRAEARARLGLAPDGPVVLAVGGLTERKNPLGLLQAFARVCDGAARMRGWRWWGDGPLAPAVDAGVGRLGLDGAVIRPGAVAHREVADWIAACDLLAIVSRVEPLGVAALEALAGGRPVVATRIGGVGEVVPDPEAGRLVDPLDPAAIASAILAVLDDPPAPRPAGAPPSPTR